METPAAEARPAPEQADSESLPPLIKWAEKYFSSWVYPSVTVGIAMVIWKRHAIAKTIRDLRRTLMPVTIGLPAAGDREYPVFTPASFLGISLSRRLKRTYRLTNETLSLLVPPNKLLVSHRLSAIERLVITDPTDQSKIVELMLNFADASDPEKIIMAETQLEPFLWDLYNRCPHVPYFIFTSEIPVLGPNPDFVDLLLIRCRFEEDPYPLNTRSINRLSRDDDAVWEKFVYRAMNIALRLQRWDLLINRTVASLSIPSSPRTAAKVFAKIAADGVKAIDAGNESLTLIAWYTLRELIFKLDGPFLTQAVTEPVLQWLLTMADDTNKIGPNTVIILENLLVVKNIHNETFEREFAALLDKLQHRPDPVQAFRCKYILTHSFADKAKQQANQQQSDAHRIRMVSARESPGLRISNLEELPTVLSDDPSLFHTITATHKVQSGRWYYEVHLLTDGLFQIGWASEHATPNPDLDVGKGVGDDKFSYAYDGQRCFKWHETQSKYGKHWKSDDVVGCYYDMVKRTISFSLNGDDLGVAFSNVDPDTGLMPAVSLQFGQMCRFNFGSKPMRFEQDPSWSLLSSLPEGCVPVLRRSGLTTSRENLRSSSVSLRASTTLCGICASAPANCILSPCKHSEICTGCAEKCAKCPWCRTPITGRDELRGGAASSASSSSLSSTIAPAESPRPSSIAAAPPSSGRLSPAPSPAPAEPLPSVPATPAGPDASVVHLPTATPAPSLSPLLVAQSPAEASPAAPPPASSSQEAPATPIALPATTPATPAAAPVHSP